VRTPNREASAGRGVHADRSWAAKRTEYCYVKFARDVQRYVQSIVHDAHDAEDITHNVFVKLLCSLDSYDERKAPFSAWLLRIARNAALDHLRQRRAEPCDDFLVARMAPVRSDPDESAALRVAFAGLPDEQRKVVFLRCALGLSPGEIADVLGRTEASVNGLEHRGRGALKVSLGRQHMKPATVASARDQALP
jgi:RNA polymerase sigma-70 factor (ECF subfamily)